MGRVKAKLLEIESMTDQMTITRSMRLDQHDYVEYIWVTKDGVYYDDENAFETVDNVKVPLAAFIIEGKQDNSKYVVLSRKKLAADSFKYVQTYSDQTVAGCKEFIEQFINEPITQEIMELNQ